MSAVRVLFVTHASRVAGAELVLLDVVQAFRGARAFLLEDGPLRSALAAMDITSILPGAAGGLARMLIRLIRAARGADLVYANSPKAFALAAPACAVARRPLIWHLHDILSSDRFGTRRIKLSIRLANSCAIRVIVPSAAAGDAFTAAGGRRSLLRIVPNGIDDVPGGTTPASRDVHGLDCPLVFGVFSRLAPCKGQAIALQALQAAPDVGCVIVGGALFGEDEYARSLVTLATELGVSDRVRFLGHREHVPALMRAVDAVVHPSIEPEPFSRTLVEAMLARRPVIATDAGAVPEILEGGRVGLMFPPGDHVALAACLRRVQAGEARALIDPAERRARLFYNTGRMRGAITEVVAEFARPRA